jgi:hypothetical protein
MLNGKPTRMGDLFSSVESDRVSYRPMTVEGGKPMAAPSPFIKHELFKSQSEVRIVFQPNGQALPDILKVKIDKPHKYFREVFRERPLPDAPWPEVIQLIRFLLLLRLRRNAFRHDTL